MTSRSLGALESGIRIVSSCRTVWVRSVSFSMIGLIKLSIFLYSRIFFELPGAFDSSRIKFLQSVSTCLILSFFFCPTRLPTISISFPESSTTISLPSSSCEMCRTYWFLSEETMDVREPPDSRGRYMSLPLEFCKLTNLLVTLGLVSTLLLNLKSVDCWAVNYKSSLSPSFGVEKMICCPKSTFWLRVFPHPNSFAASNVDWYFFVGVLQ